MSTCPYMVGPAVVKKEEGQLVFFTCTTKKKPGLGKSPKGHLQVLQPSVCRAESSQLLDLMHLMPLLTSPLTLQNAPIYSAG